jgi:O-antigen ligase
VTIDTVALTAKPALLALPAVAAAVAIVATPPVASAMVLVGATSLALGYRAPSWGLAVLVSTIPVQDAGAVQAGAIELTWTKIVLFGVVSGWALAVASRLNRVRIDALGCFLIAYCLVLLASVQHARSLVSWAEESYRWVVTALAFIVARDSMRHRSGWDRQLPVAIGLGVVGCTGLASWQVATGAGPPSYQAEGGTRAFGTFGAPNSFAVYLSMATLVLAAVILEPVARASRWEHVRCGWRELALGAAALAGTLSLLLTQSRGGLLGFAAGCTTLAMLGGGRVRTVAGAIVVAALAVTIALGGGRQLADRFETLASPRRTEQVTVQNFAVRERIAHWRGAVAMWRAHPWLGVGAGNFDERFREFTTEWRFRIGRGHAHSSYLQALSQGGSVGLAAYLLVLLAFLAATIRAARSRPAGPERAAAIGAAAMTVAIGVHGFVEYTHVLSLGLLAAVVWAVGTGPLPVQGRAR